MTFKTLYDVLDGIRERPAMYLGPIVIEDPFPMFFGFFQGLRHSDMNPGKPSIWEFSSWLSCRLPTPTNMPFEVLYRELGSKGAYEAFFQYLDEYRGCTEIEVAVAHPVELNPKFYCMDSNGNRVPPPLPDKLYVGQFCPSNVFFLGEVYGTNTQRRLPYCGNAKAVRAKAKSEWGVPLSAWPQRTSRST